MEENYLQFEVHTAAAFNSSQQQQNESGGTDKMNPNSFVLSAQDDGCVMSTALVCALGSFGDIWAVAISSCVFHVHITIFQQ